MSERRDEKWLDGELRRVINTSRPEFDAEAWKRNHAEAYQTLISRGQRISDSDMGTRRRVRLIVGRLVAAAVILIAAAILLTRMPPRDPQEPAVAASEEVASPANMMSMISLTMAYRRGGEEALNRQLDTALETLGPRPDRSLLNDLLSDIEG